MALRPVYGAAVAASSVFLLHGCGIAPAPSLAARNCSVNVHCTAEHDKDSDTPLWMLGVAVRPEVGLWCYWGSRPYAWSCAHALIYEDYQCFADAMLHVTGRNNRTQVASWQAIRTTQEEITIYTKDIQFPYDDFYCYHNGWFNLTRSANEPDYGELATKYCKTALEDEFPEYWNLTMAQMEKQTWYEDYLIHEHFTQTPAFFWSVNGTDARRHAAWKCALGELGVGCDMAFCHSYGCLRTDIGEGYIGHHYDSSPDSSCPSQAVV